MTFTTIQEFGVLVKISASLLQSSVLHDPSEIAQESVDIIIISAENSCSPK